MITIEFLNGRAPLEIEAKTIAEAVKKALDNGINLRGADLYGADLRGADLRGTDLSYTDLRGADLHGADLRGTDLRGTDLHGTDLHGADLRGTDLRGTDLSGTDLSGANLDYSCWPLRCGSLNAKIDKRLFIQLLYHTVRAGQSVKDEEVRKFLNMPEVIALANQFHRVNECGKIEKKEMAE